MAKNGCCCTILSIILKITIIVSIVSIIFWLSVRPKRVKLNVTGVTLSEFSLTEKNILTYNLTMNITIYNPNKKMGIYYDRIKADAYYDETKRFDTVMLTPFYQGHKNTSYLMPVFEGQRLLVLNANELSKFNKEKNNGVYSILVELDLKVRFKFGKMKVQWLLMPMISCDLKVPLASANGTSAGGTEGKCVASI